MLASSSLVSDLVRALKSGANGLLDTGYRIPQENHRTVTQEGRASQSFPHDQAACERRVVHDACRCMRHLRSHVQSGP